MRRNAKECEGLDKNTPAYSVHIYRIRRAECRFRHSRNPLPSAAIALNSRAKRHSMVPRRSDPSLLRGGIMTVSQQVAELPRCGVRELQLRYAEVFGEATSAR